MDRSNADSPALPITATVAPNLATAQGVVVCALILFFVLYAGIVADGWLGSGFVQSLDPRTTHILQVVYFPLELLCLAVDGLAH